MKVLRKFTRKNGDVDSTIPMDLRGTFFGFFHSIANTTCVRGTFTDLPSIVVLEATEAHGEPHVADLPVEGLRTKLGSDHVGRWHKRRRHRNTWEQYHCNREGTHRWDKCTGNGLVGEHAQIDVVTVLGVLNSRTSEERREEEEPTKVFEGCWQRLDGMRTLVWVRLLFSQVAIVEVVADTAQFDGQDHLNASKVEIPRDPSKEHQVDVTCHDHSHAEQEHDAMRGGARAEDEKQVHNDTRGDWNDPFPRTNAKDHEKH
mmetsp:Transcript_52365/g.131549  ORF Transcript_52365/g.131549 Transcript_52365/m.131549 type:complete len:259 (+) Transcript_52365:509-1285(+)